VGLDGMESKGFEGKGGEEVKPTLIFLSSGGGGIKIVKGSKLKKG